MSASKLPPEPDTAPPASAPADELLAALAALPAPAPLSDLSAERIRRAARSALEHEVARESSAARRAVRRVWSRALMPAMVAATCCVYFGWAVQAAAALYR